MSIALPEWARVAVSTGAAGGDRLPMAGRLAAHFLGSGMAPGSVARAMSGFARACEPELTAVELADVIRHAAGYQGDAERAGVVDVPDVAPLPSGAGWRYTWPAVGVALALDRLTYAGGRIMAELTVDAAAAPGGAMRRIHGPSRLDLLSTGAMSEAARWLEKRRPGPWGDILENAFRLAIETHRTGEPAMFLRDAVLDAGGGYAIDPLVLEGDPTMFFAKGGAGKSLIALAVAAALDGGDGILPLPVRRRHRVAFLDWEWRPGRHLPRLSALLGDRLGECGILYRSMSGPLIGQLDQVQRMIAEHGITYVVVDSVALACGDDPEKSSSALPFAGAIRALGVGSLWVAHVPKHGDDTEPYGSAFWRNTVRSAWQVQSLSEPGASVMRLALHHRKANDGPPRESIGLTLAWGGGRLSITRSDVDVADDRAFQAGISKRARVAAHLAMGPARAAEIAEVKGMTLKEAERELSALVREGRAIELSDGRVAMSIRGERRNGPVAAVEIATSEPLPW